MPRKYSKGSQEMVREEMHEMKEGKLRSGSGKKVTNPKQAIAIGLSEARKEGEKVPQKPSGKSGPGKSPNTKKTASKKNNSTKKTTARKSIASKKTASGR